MKAIREPGWLVPGAAALAGGIGLAAVLARPIRQPTYCGRHRRAPWPQYRYLWKGRHHRDA
jgi:hypothetical protein